MQRTAEQKSGRTTGKREGVQRDVVQRDVVQRDVVRRSAPRASVPARTSIGQSINLPVVVISAAALLLIIAAILLIVRRPTEVREDPRRPPAAVERVLPAGSGQPTERRSPPTIPRASAGDPREEALRPEGNGSEGADSRQPKDRGRSRRSW